MQTHIETTPLKFNMEPEGGYLEKEKKRTWKPSFSGSMLNFGGVLIKSKKLFLKSPETSCEVTVICPIRSVYLLSCGICLRFWSCLKIRDLPQQSMKIIVVFFLFTQIESPNG